MYMYILIICLFVYLITHLYTTYAGIDAAHWVDIEGAWFLHPKGLIRQRILNPKP